MQGLLGTLVGIVVITIGLAGLGVALTQMMTHADPNGTLISLGGLGAFIVSLFVMLALIR
jgi:hypothetical protein